MLKTLSPSRSRTNLFLIRRSLATSAFDDGPTIRLSHHINFSLLVLLFVCIDAASTRDGWGTSVLMLAHERGDPRRMFIGGVGGLYRVFKYSGQWSEGVRQVHALRTTWAFKQ